MSCSPGSLELKADLARESEHHLTTARAVQIPKYSQIGTESRLFCAPSSRHVTSLSCCQISLIFRKTAHFKQHWMKFFVISRIIEEETRRSFTSYNCACKIYYFHSPTVAMQRTSQSSPQEAEESYLTVFPVKFTVEWIIFPDHLLDMRHFHSHFKDLWAIQNLTEISFVPCLFSYC